MVVKLDVPERVIISCPTCGTHHSNNESTLYAYYGQQLSKVKQTGYQRYYYISKIRNDTSYIKMYFVVLNISFAPPRALNNATTGHIQISRTHLES